MSNTSPKYFCFVLMPFSTEFEDIYEYGIKECCKNTGCYCERVDEQIFHGTVLERIYNQISKADLILADMSGKSPNVFYEVGYAHALNKPTILLTTDADDIPFDLKHYPHIIYEGKISVVREELPKRLRWFKENSSSNLPTLKTEINLYVNDQNLLTGTATLEYKKEWQPYFELTIHNASSVTYEVGDFQIGVLTDVWSSCATVGTSSIKLSGNQYMHILPLCGRLFPESYTFIPIKLKAHGETYNLNPETEITLRVFTKFGYKDYKLKLKRRPE